MANGKLAKHGFWIDAKSPYHLLCTPAIKSGCGGRTQPPAFVPTDTEGLSQAGHSAVGREQRYHRKAHSTVFLRDGGHIERVRLG
jgi:hypothetical protein